MRRGACRLWGKCKTACFPHVPDIARVCPPFAGFAGVFYRFLEFHDTDHPGAGRAASCSGACGMGICPVPFSGEKGAVVSLYASDDPAVSGNNGIWVSGPEYDGLNGHPCGGDPAGYFLHTAGIYPAEDLCRYSEGTAGGGKD